MVFNGIAGFSCSFKSKSFNQTNVLNFSQALMKLLNSRYAKDFYWTISLIQDIYTCHSKTKSREISEYFEKFASFTELLFKLMLGGFGISPFAFILYPVYMYFVNDELITIIPLYLPGIDETTVVGFIILNLYLLLISIIGSICLSALEFLMAIIIISSLIFAKIVSSELQQINTDLQDDDCGMLAMIGRFRNIFLMHQQMGEYEIFFF